MKIVDGTRSGYSHYISKILPSVGYHDEPKFLKMQEIIKLIIATEWFCKEKGVQVSKEWINKSIETQKEIALKSFHEPHQESVELPKEMIPSVPSDFNPPDDDVSVCTANFKTCKSLRKDVEVQKFYGYLNFAGAEVHIFKEDGTEICSRKCVKFNRIIGNPFFLWENLQYVGTPQQASAQSISIDCNSEIFVTPGLSKQDLQCLQSLLFQLGLKNNSAVEQDSGDKGTNGKHDLEDNKGAIDEHNSEGYNDAEDKDDSESNKDFDDEHDSEDHKSAEGEHIIDEHNSKGDDSAEVEEDSENYEAFSKVLSTLSKKIFGQIVPQKSIMNNAEDNSFHLVLPHHVSKITVDSLLTLLNDRFQILLKDTPIQVSIKSIAPSNEHINNSKDGVIISTSRECFLNGEIKCSRRTRLNKVRARAKGRKNLKSYRLQRSSRAGVRARARRVESDNNPCLQLPINVEVEDYTDTKGRNWRVTFSIPFEDLEKPMFSEIRFTEENLDHLLSNKDPNSPVFVNSPGLPSTIIPGVSSWEELFSELSAPRPQIWHDPYIGVGERTAVGGVCTRNFMTVIEPLASGAGLLGGTVQSVFGTVSAIALAKHKAKVDAIEIRSERHEDAINKVIIEKLEEIPISISTTFNENWTKPNTHPDIIAVLSVSNEDLQNRWEKYRKRLGNKKHPDNYVTFYHGTTLKCDIIDTEICCKNLSCGICGISCSGMDYSYISTKHFGEGFYLASSSSWSSYLNHNESGPPKATLLCDILPGLTYSLQTNCHDFAGKPKDYDSVFGYIHGAVEEPEMIIYNSCAIMPRYIIVYTENSN